MRAPYWTMLCLLLPSSMAAGQFLDRPDNAAGGAPPPAQAGEEIGQRGPGGPPNVMFSILDANSDGKITTRELRRAAVLLKKLDVDKDGNITLAEIAPRGGPGGQVGPAGPGGPPNQFVEEIMQNDRNADGKLSNREIPDHLKAMLANADTDGDRAVDRAELLAAIEVQGNQFQGGPGWRGGAGGPNAAFDPSQMTGQLMRNDLNRDGRLTTNELPPAAVGMLQGSDQNNDGAIDARELQAFSRAMGERARAFAPGAGNQPNGPAAPGRNGRGRERPRNEN